MAKYRSGSYNTVIMSGSLLQHAVFWRQKRAPNLPIVASHINNHAVILLLLKFNFAINLT